MVVGDPITIYRTSSFQPAGTNVFVILWVTNNGNTAPIGIQDGATTSSMIIVNQSVAGNSNTVQMTKFNIDNTHYFYAQNAASSATGFQIG